MSVNTQPANKQVDMTKPISKILHIATRKVAPSESQFEKIRPYLIDSDIQPEQLYIRQIRIANDQHDRSFERFDLGYLARFAETIIGKSILTGHEYGNAPVGRMFDAGVVKDESTGWHWLEVWFYMPVSSGNQLERDNIDSGVWSYASIGAQVDYAGLVCDLCGQSYYPWTASDSTAAKCPHILGESYDGKVATATWTSSKSNMDIVEGIESSIVFLGCQYDAAIAKSAEQSGELTARKREIITLANTPSSDGEKSQEGVMNLEKLLEALGLKSAEDVQAEVSKLRSANAELKSLADIGTKLMESIRTEIKGHMQFLAQPEAIQCTVDLITNVDELTKMRDDLAKARADKAQKSGQGDPEAGSVEDPAGGSAVKSGIVNYGYDVI